MSSAPPTSLLISPDLRRRLQQRYEEAQRVAACLPADFRRIHDLVAECVRADPGNILYLDALLANLQRWQPKRSWLPKWLRGWSRPADRAARDSRRMERSVPGTQYSVPSGQYTALCRAPEHLRHGHDDAALLRQLALAAGDCEFDEVELRYWQLAAGAAPPEVESLRGLAQALTRQGRFEQAAAAWTNLLATSTADSEAAAALVDLDQQAAAQIEAQERTLADAQAAGGPLLSILQQREELQLDRAGQRLQVARRRAAEDPHPKAAALAQRLADEYDRLEIEILHLRCERLPNDWEARLELGRRLKRAGNYSGALARLDEAASLQPGAAAILIEQGECWQHLRQFVKALDYYARAIPLAGDEKKLALYRAGVLASAMNMPDGARQYLAELVALDPGFQDARERLDNLQGS